MAAVVNYAQQYERALAQAFPFVLKFGELWDENKNGVYQVRKIDAKTIQIPKIITSGRVDGDRDTIGEFKRRHSNEWETKVLKNHRTWDTLVHPMDVKQTNMVMSIQNATKVYNETQKFPEMDAYTVSMLHALRTELDADSDNTEALTVDNVLEVFDTAMEAMDEENVPEEGRILYVTPAVKKLIKNAKDVVRSLDIGNNKGVILRDVSRIDEVKIKPVPSKLMQTAYDFTEGFKKAGTAKQINMFLVHPKSVLPIVSYAFAGMEEPKASTKGKYLYFEESFEDIFILEARKAGLFFNVAGA